jgi:hypothetical protein
LPVLSKINLSIITIYTPFFFEKKTGGVLNPFFSYFIINEKRGLKYSRDRKGQYI